jgi:hypothetical protein
LDDNALFPKPWRLTPLKPRDSGLLGAAAHETIGSVVPGHQVEGFEAPLLPMPGSKL